jgi:hypothetical protein
VDKVRRSETQTSNWAQNWLSKTQWIWRKNPENWTDTEALRTVELEKEHLLHGQGLPDAFGPARNLLLFANPRSSVIQQIDILIGPHGW